MAFTSAESRCNHIRNKEEIHSYEFASLVASVLDKPIAIPKQFVDSETLLWKESEYVPISPVYFHNRLSGYLEELRANNLLYAPPIHEFRRKLSSIFDVHTAPFDTEIKRYRTVEELLPQGIQQFSREPDIPLSEYVKLYGILPSRISSRWKEFEQIPQRAYKYSPRDEREAIFILEIQDEDLLDILLGVLHEVEKPIIEDYEPDFPDEEIFFREGCENNHPNDLAGGWDSSFAVFMNKNDFCLLCKLHSTLFRNRTLKEGADDPDKRSHYEACYQESIETLRSYVQSKYPERIDEVAFLLGDNDIFDASDEDLFGGALFD
jgi:hypothetical protein